MAVADNFSIVRGDTYEETWVLTDSLGAAVDLTGGKLYFTMKNNFTDADGSAIIALSSPASGIVITSAPTGAATFTITAAQSAAFVVGSYKYDVQFKDVNGLIKTLVRGIVTVDYDVTISTA